MLEWVQLEVIQVVPEKPYFNEAPNHPFSYFLATETFHVCSEEPSDALMQCDFGWGKFWPVTRRQVQGLAILVPPILKVVIQMRQSHAPHMSLDNRVDAQIHYLQPFCAVRWQLFEG